MAAVATAAVGPRYAPEDPTLPKPWKGLVDGKTGYLYFWNPVTNVTQYERPLDSVPPQKSVSMPISSSVQIQPSQGQRSAGSPHEDKDSYDKGSNGGSRFDVTPSRTQQARSETEPVHSAAHNGFVSSDGGQNMALSSGYGGAARGPGPSEGGSVTAEAYRRRHEITVTGNSVPPPFTTFEATGFPSEILREVLNAGFTAPTPIQAQAWPVALQGKDIVAVAKTGSGKTVGYVFPGFMHIKRLNNDPRMGPTVLVLSPTRELATQIQDEAAKFGKSSRISCVCLYGGAPKGPQLRELDRGADIVVATPGRLNDILEMRRISLHQVSYLVLDEADRMLDMGFEPQIRKIVKEVPTRRQTLMFTATWPKEVRKIAADLLVNPVQVNIGNVDELVANKSITQHIEILAPMEKHRRLEQILRSQEPGSKIIIFCSTKKMCDQLSRNLSRQFGAAAIHGDKSQSERDSVLSQFRSGRTPILVATDVAARGLDIKDIRVVVNYDFPTGVEDYVHRIGRTGRAGASGEAYTFFGEQDAKYASDLIKVLEGANQRVSPEIRSMASRGGGFGMSKFRRWGSGPSSSGGGRDGGYGGRGDSGYGGRNGGRGGFDSGSRDRFDRGYQNDKGRSPERGSGSGWGDRNRGSNRERSRSRSRSPVRPGRSFHQQMMEKSRGPPPFGINNNVSSNGRDQREEGFGGSNGGGQADRSRSSRYGEEPEEGMIPQDE